MENTVVKSIRAVADRLPDQVALKARDAKGAWQQWTYREFCDLAEQFGAGLLDFGVKRGDHVGIISDNRKEWIIADQGILGIGAADVPRGSDTMPDEMRYILQHADCAITLAENAEQLEEDPFAEEGPSPPEDDHRHGRGVRPARASRSRSRA